MDHFLVNIALPLPLDQVFTYIMPEELRTHAAKGKRVLVPFGKKLLTGVIVDFPTSTNISSLKSVLDILDTKPTFSPKLLAFTQWIAEYYLTPWGEVLRAAIPQGYFQESSTIVRLQKNINDLHTDELSSYSRTQKQILNVLQQKPSIKLSLLRKQCGNKTIHAALKELQAEGLISINVELEKPRLKPKTEKTVSVTPTGREIVQQNILPPKQQQMLETLINSGELSENEIPLQLFLKSNRFSLSTLRTLAEKGYVAVGNREILRTQEEEPREKPPQFNLNTNQANAVEQISHALEAKAYKAFLLHGVTGSGKTQVYIETIRHTLSLGKTALVLVPEISLTPQTVRRFKAHFGEEVAVTHSQMSPGQRYDVWRMAQNGTIKIVIGPRSVIFTPLENIGLIVVDEEHESSYKQFDAAPRYNARDAALVRAHQSNAVVVLGSATPSIESYYNARQGKYTLLELPQRIDGAQLPAIELVDMREERKKLYEEVKQNVEKNGGPFPKHLPPRSISLLLREHIQRRIEKNESVILMQNRRGFSHVLECYECGYVEKCDNCEVPLTYHSAKKHLRCHYCGLVKKTPLVCPKCQGTELRFYAFGTQQVENELQELFPTASIVRMDRDTTNRKGAHRRILKSFETGEANILLGTQMVAKGLDFPRVTLVGVISADTQMLLPDFRSAETTFQLLTQVAGRAGRSAIAGEVIIQTLQPEHYSLKHVLQHNYTAFYEEEIIYRKELYYPPFSRLTLIEFIGKDEEQVQRHAQIFVQHLQHYQQNKFTVLGPADAALPKINNRYRKHIVIKSFKHLDPAGVYLRQSIRAAYQQYTSSSPTPSKTIDIIIDIDPHGMM